MMDFAKIVLRLVAVVFIVGMLLCLYMMVTSSALWVVPLCVCGIGAAGAGVSA
jgi:hypothetical protein